MTVWFDLGIGVKKMEKELNRPIRFGPIWLGWSNEETNIRDDKTSIASESEV